MLVNSTGQTNERGETVFVTDQMVDALLAQFETGESRREAENKAKALSKEDIHKFRIRAKRDLFFLCSSILGNRRLSPRLHGELCTWIKTNENVRFKGYLYARGNFKTTVITIGHSIQLSLPVEKEDLEYDGWWLDEDVTPIPWPASLGKDIRILIGHETHESAARFLYSITGHFTSNPMLMALFPECVPTPRRHRVNKWELELPRSTIMAEPTFDTLGVGGKSQGRHYNYIKLDDIWGDKARDSEAEAETTRQWFDNIQSFFDTFSKDHLDLTGTRWSFDDVYSHAMDRYGKKMKWITKKIEERDPATGKMYSTFPEEFPLEDLEVLKKNKVVYNAQYLNDPAASGEGFDEEWKKYFYWVSPHTIAVFDGTEKTLINVRDLDIIFLIDPGRSKTGGFCITGMDYFRRVFTLVALALEGNPATLTELVFNSVIRWQPRTVVIETDFFANLFKNWWEAEMKLRSTRFHVTEYHTKKLAKDDRIRGLANYYANGQLFMNEQQAELLNEYGKFGKSKDIHILDALAQGPENWKPGWAPGTRSETLRAAQNPMAGRDVQTGYSAVD